MKKRTLRRIIRFLEDELQAAVAAVDESPDYPTLDLARKFEKAINAKSQEAWEAGEPIPLVHVYVTAFGEVPIRWEFEEKQDPVKQCPGCKMAIYDGAAERGWCLNCLPLTDAELESELPGCDRYEEDHDPEQENPDMCRNCSYHRADHRL